MVLGCEAGFTLFALPVLGRYGALGVSVHSTWLAAIGFAVIGLVSEGPRAAARLTARELLAAGYLAVAVTAVPFLLWNTCVRSIGAGRAGLLTA
ncbi:MAG: EamA family transporter [Actinomycetota bacterium]|nr:EamA family transporter [Actinomycetota bacterium]